MQKKSTKPIVGAILLALLGLLYPSTPVHAVNKWITCTPANVMVAGNRIHVRCVNKKPGVSWSPSHDPEDRKIDIRFFAAPTANEKFANRVQSLMQTALVAGKKLRIRYNMDDITNGPKFGCLKHDCRPILLLAIKR